MQMLTAQFHMKLWLLGHVRQTLSQLQKMDSFFSWGKSKRLLGCCHLVYRWEHLYLSPPVSTWRALLRFEEDLAAACLIWDQLAGGQKRNNLLSHSEWESNTSLSQSALTLITGSSGGSRLLEQVWIIPQSADHASHLGHFILPWLRLCCFSLVLMNGGPLVAHPLCHLIARRLYVLALHECERVSFKCVFTLISHFMFNGHQEQMRVS